MAEQIALFPLHTILFPHTDLGLHVFEPPYLKLIANCLLEGEPFGVSLIRQGRKVEGSDEPHPIGTLARIAAYARLPDGRYLMEVEGFRRYELMSFVRKRDFPVAQVVFLPEPIGNFARARRASEVSAQLFGAYLQTSGEDGITKLPADPVARSYFIASELGIDPPEKQVLLAIESADERLEAISTILRRELALREHLQSGRV